MFRYFGVVLILTCFAPSSARDVFFHANGPFFNSTIRVDENLPLNQWNEIFDVDANETMEFWYKGVQLNSSSSPREMDLDRNAKIDCLLDAKFLGVKPYFGGHIIFVAEIKNLTAELESIVVAATENTIYVAQKIERQIGFKTVTEIEVKKTAMKSPHGLEKLKRARYAKPYLTTNFGRIYVEIFNED